MIFCDKIDYFLYKDALEANSPLIRANCWEWYTSVVRTRMHNASRELIVFTRFYQFSVALISINKKSPTVWPRIIFI